MKKPTMQDIADELNVSRNTISRALRNKNGVSEQTKREVKAIAERIGYIYNKDKVEEAKSGSKHFILLVSSFAITQTGFFGIIIEELKDIVKENKDTIEVIEIPRDNIEQQTLILSKIKKYTSELTGIFILSHITNEFIENIINLKYPTVLIDHHSPKLKTDSVVSQNEFGTYDLVDYLIKQGIKEIGFIGNTSLSPSYRERYIGYRQALEDHSLAFDSSYVISDIQEEQKALFERISNLDKMPESWFCVNSGLAFILNTYLHSKGFSVPEDVSIVCFDDTDFSRQSSPPITCVGTDLKLLAKISYSRMGYRLLNPEESYTEIRILPEFYERASVLKSHTD
ncbi:LacI family DNA-binding transcriptional regulator [Alkalibacterium putridalgicola]|uniref:LacI family DNA-binding transcriptional regulator n=1 Tax=Alkalibacterium putridalgicola TaxID=426703 RepID=UPI0034D00775